MSLKVVPCQLRPANLRHFRTQLNHRHRGRARRGARGAGGARARGRAPARAHRANMLARSASFYSHYLLTFELNGVALLKFKQNNYRRNGTELGYRNEKMVLEWPSLSSPRPNKNPKHLVWVVSFGTLPVSFAQTSGAPARKV